LIDVLAIVPSGSLEPVVEAETIKGADPLLGVTANIATGGIFATAVAVTVFVAVPVAPLLSVTVAVTVNVPTTAYVCVPDAAAVVLPSPQLMTVLAMVPSGSLEPVVEAETISGIAPLDGVTERTATGGTFAAFAVTVLVAVPVAPLLSVTVAVTVYVPAVVYVCEPDAAAVVVPSPQLMDVLAMVPSGSLEPVVEAETFNGTVPLVGVTERTATGG
jgi:hypothetical protein